MNMPNTFTPAPEVPPAHTATVQTIPFVIFGDAPTLSTGLGRIGRDLTAQIHQRRFPSGMGCYQQL